MPPKKSRPKPVRHLRILFVDDHPLVCEGVRSCLAQVPHLKFVGEATDGEEALRLVGTLQPDVVLMDVNMPKMNGIQTTARLRDHHPTCRVLGFSVHHQREYVLQLIHAGACGYVTKDAPPAELIRAIEVVGAGGSYFTDQAAGALRSNSPSAKKSVLSAREREVVALVAEGLSNKLIADRLGVSVRTVESHRHRVMGKLDIYSVAKLTSYAIAQGLVRVT